MLYRPADMLLKNKSAVSRTGAASDEVKTGLLWGLQSEPPLAQEGSDNGMNTLVRGWAGWITKLLGKGYIYFTPQITVFLIQHYDKYSSFE